MFVVVTTYISRSLLTQQIRLKYSKRCFQKKLLENVVIPTNTRQRYFLSTQETLSSTSSSTRKDTNDDSSLSIEDKNIVYLHVGPSGDCWTGSSIFAAKHLQPDYVKSIVIDENKYDIEKITELLEDNDTWTKQIYDEECIPDDLLDELSKS